MFADWNTGLVEALRAPVPESEIKTRVQGGRTLRYTTDKFVFDRLDETVGPQGWQDDYVVVGTSVTCHLKVLGVMKSAVSDTNDKASFGGPYMNGQARALKRAAMKFGIARELWDKEEDEDTTPAKPTRPTKPAPAAAARPAAKSGGLSDRQIGLLKAMKLNDATIATLTRKHLNSAEYGGLDIIGKLKAAQGDDPTVERAKRVLAKAGVKWVDKAASTDDYEDDEYEDEDYEDDEE